MNGRTGDGPRVIAGASPRAWLIAAFAVALSLALVGLATRGAVIAGTHDALRMTARGSYRWFWCAYAGGALSTLFGARFQPMARRAGDFGLAFAAAQLVHAALVVWLYRISPQPPVSTRLLELFGFALICTYTLGLLSIRRVARLLGPRLWPVVRFGAVEYIAFAFLIDFLKNPFVGGSRNALAYVPFLALALPAAHGCGSPRMRRASCSGGQLRRETRGH